MPSRLPYRAVFISDVHLGSAASRADAAADFLKHVECDTLYLVGDIIDMWRLRSRWYWPETHNKFIRRVLKMAKHGTRVVFIPGNHDEHARDYAGLNFGGVELVREAVHTTADGRRLLIIHGDEVDAVVRHHRALSMIGGAAYDKLVTINRWSNIIRRGMGLQPWSMSAAIKQRVKRACQHVAKFEQTLADEAARRGLDGVVCGHIHKAEIRTILTGDGREVQYFNCGDWVESLTALVEYDDGTLRVIKPEPLVATLRDRDDAEEPVLAPSSPAMS